MFTGIVEARGEVLALSPAAGGLRVRIAHSQGLDLATGDSVCVSGVCLTAIGVRRGSFGAEIGPETKFRTTLGLLRVGDTVNLERPLRADARLGGHVVLGHVDGVARVVRMKKTGSSRRVSLALPLPLVRYVAPQGSLAVDGVSLTVAAMEGNTADVMLIPHTLAATTLAGLAPGDTLNVEVDVVARYVARMLGPGESPGRAARRIRMPRAVAGFRA